MTRSGLRWSVALLLVAGCVAPGAAASPGPSQADPRFGACLGNAGAVIAAFPMAAASDYHVHLPQMGISPELDTSMPAFVVVFAGFWPGPVSGAAPPPGTTWPPRSLAPGTHDVCIWVGDATTGVLNVYDNVDTTGMTP